MPILGSSYTVLINILYFVCKVLQNLDYMNEWVNQKRKASIARVERETFYLLLFFHVTNEEN